MSYYLEYTTQSRNRKQQNQLWECISKVLKLPSDQKSRCELVSYMSYLNQWGFCDKLFENYLKKKLERNVFPVKISHIYEKKRIGKKQLIPTINN
jgi:hypothetical protein